MSLDRDLIYRISVQGLAESAGALEGFNTRLKTMAEQEAALQRFVNEAARKASTGRRKVVDEEAAHRAQLNKLQVDLETRRARDSVRAAEKAEREKAKAVALAAKQAAKEIAANENAVSKAQQAAVAQRLKEYAAAEREKTRIAKAEAKEREANEKAVARAQQASAEVRLRQNASAIRAQEREQRQAQRRAIRDEEQRMRDAVFDNKRFFRSALGGTFASVGTGFHDTLSVGKRLVGAGMRGARGFASAMGLDDAMDMQSIIHEQAKVGKLLDDVAIEARVPGATMSKGVVRDEKGNTLFDRKKTGREIRMASENTGVRQDVLAAAIDEGSRLGSGKDIANEIASVAEEVMMYGGDEQAARSVAKVRTQLKTSAEAFGKTLTPEDISDYIKKLYVAGKSGNMRGSEVAKYAEGIISSAMAGGVDFAAEADQQIQWMQFTNSVTGGPARTKTALSAVADQIAKKEQFINGLGVKTRGEDGSKLSELQVIKDMLQATGGEGANWNKVFEPSRSGKAVTIMAETYAAAERSAKGTGLAAVNARLDKFKLTSAAVNDDFRQDVGLERQNPNKRLEMASTSIRNAFADQLLPVMEQMAKDAPGYAAAIVSVVQAIGPVIRDSLMPELVKLSKQAPAIAAGIVSATQSLGPVLKWLTDMLVNHPVQSAALAVGAGTVVSAIPRALQYGMTAFGGWAGDKLGTALSPGGTVPRLGAGAVTSLLGSAAGGAGSLLASAGSTPVFVTGVAPGVSMGGGGAGVGDLTSGLGAGGLGAGGLGTGAVGGAAESISAFTTTMAGGLVVAGGFFAALGGLAVLVNEIQRKRDPNSQNVTNFDATFGRDSNPYAKRNASEEDTKELNGILAERADSRSGMVNMLSGKDPTVTAKEAENQKKSLLLLGLGDVATQVESGKLSTMEAVAQVGSMQSNPGGPMKFRTDSSGELTGSLDAKQIKEAVDAITILGRRARETAGELSGVSANASMIKNPPAP